MNITNSLQWNDVRLELKLQIQNLPYNADLRKMLRNIDTLVFELSKAEVDARRTKQKYYSEEKLKRVNEGIENIEKMILLAALMG